jgi:hypothetical protein
MRTHVLQRAGRERRTAKLLVGIDPAPSRTADAAVPIDDLGLDLLDPEALVTGHRQPPVSGGEKHRIPLAGVRHRGASTPLGFVLSYLCALGRGILGRHTCK